MSGAEAALRAARLGDEVVHGFGLMGLVAGALIGAAIAAVIIVAGVATGGLAIVAIVAGCIAGGGLAGGALARGIMKAADLPGPTTGTLAAAGASRVTVNGRLALRAGMDFAPGCSGAPMNHFTMPGPVLIAEGSKTVTINGRPMARQSMRLVCGAKIKGGSSNVTVGGPTVCVVDITDYEAMFETTLQVLGFVALGAAGAGAFAAGLGATLVFGAVVSGSALGMMKLHEWGESLGPGYGDIMVGVAGFALLFATPKLSRLGHGSSTTPRSPAFKPGVVADDIVGVPKGSRPAPETYLEQAYIDEHLGSFKRDGGAFLFTADDIANPKYPSFNPQKFLMNKTDLDGVVAQYRATGDVAVLENALGYNPGSLKGKDVFMMTVRDPDVVMPSGNEGGANNLWRPGGLTDPGGMREGVLNNFPIIHGNDLGGLKALPNVKKVP